MILKKIGIKHPVSSSRADENALLVSEDGIGILFGDDGKATVPETTACHNKGIRTASLNENSKMSSLY